MTGGWTTPADVKTALQRVWASGRMLEARVNGTPLFPLDLRFRRPGVTDLSERFDDVRQWIKALEAGGKDRLGFGYRIEWIDSNLRQLGRNRLPAGLRVESEADALRLIGKTREAERFSALAEITAARFPSLSGWLARRPMVVLDHAGDWDRVLATLAWFHAHPRSGLYLRQLDIAGVDTKFIETRRGLLAELLDQVLAPDAIGSEFTGARGFEQRYGLIVKPPLVRFRLLDAGASLHGLSDLMTPASEFATLALPVGRVFITENEINGLAFPRMANSLVVFGLGYDVARLAGADWLNAATLYYWGDIDTHGFAILDRLRGRFPHAQSLLMDRPTLMAHRQLWVREHDPVTRPLDRLTPCERALYEDIGGGVLGEGVRLEQERVAFGWVERTLAALPA